jgi:hypothetical protein
MITTNELPVNSLDYSDIRENLVSFLQSQTNPDGSLVYQDFNFQGSGISTLINLLSYHTHYIGYYIKMMLNESFIDSAVKKESLYSKAKLTGYVPRSRTSARATISLSIDIDLSNPAHREPSSRSILVPRGTSFSAANNNFDQRIFYIVDDVFVKNVDYSVPNTVKYTSDDFTIYEGKLQEWKFRIDYTLLNQRYVIQDKTVDIDTIRVIVIPDGGTNSLNGEEYRLSTNVFDVDENSLVYYISTQEEGYFEIIFGNGVFGKRPANKSIVFVYGISNNGEEGNGCKVFRFQAPSQGIPTEHNIGNWEDFSVVTAPGTISSGGVEAEDIESMRFTIPHHYRKQNRIVTEGDYRSTIISEFRNIDSISVWGGEKNYYKDYGKVYISIKPKFADKLTLTAKKDITNRLITKYTVVGMEPVFIDPEFVNVDLSVYVKIDSRKTIKSLGQFERDINTIITEYNAQTLNVFDNFLSDVTMLDLIMESDPAIRSCYSKKELYKEQSIIYASMIENMMLFSNPLLPGVKSNDFIYGLTTCYFKDDIDGKIYIYNKATQTKFIPAICGYVDYQNGAVHYTFPTYARMVEKDFGTSGIINFTVVPVNPDIETFLQNIIRITKIRVFLSNA